MSTTRVTDILRAKHAGFFIAALITSLAMESRSTELIPPKPDLYFNVNAGVVSKEAAYRCNQELLQSESLGSNRLKDRTDPGRDSASVGAILKVRLDDTGPGETVPQQHPSGASAETPTIRTFVVSPVHRQEHEPATPERTTPQRTTPERTTTSTATEAPKPFLFEDHIGTVTALIGFVIALIVIVRILRRRPRWPRDVSYNPPLYPLRIAIKFKSGGGKQPQELDGWQASFGGAAKRLAPLGLLPLFQSLDSTRLSELVARAQRNDSNYKPPDFSAWFQVETPAGVKANELVTPLRKLENVESAYVMRPGPPPSSPKKDPRNLDQSYQDPAPKGIDARYAWGFAGGDGAGVGFVDLEQGWNLNHADLKDANISIISGMNKESYPHGTEVLGGVLMVENTKGGKGIAPSSRGRVISQWRSDGTSNIADAIVDAAAKMSLGDVKGDVLLLEAQEYDQASGTYYWPVEIAEANYHAIRLATALGIVVVEAAGNGSYDLDAYTDNADKKILRRRSADFREDSGAIMVGAGSSEERSRLPFSNHGNRIDCYAWGENITTTTTNKSGTSNTRYTSNFGGTSGASSIVAGAALIVQGIAQAGLGHRLSPQELRDLLIRNGTPSKTPANDRIGMMPNLRAIITNNTSVLKPIPKPTAGPP